MNAEQLHLRRLWQSAFGDTDKTLDAFFATGFSPQRYHCIYEKDIPVSALYWFDCTLQGRRLAYLYAVATLPSHRGRGLARQLLEDTHLRLQKSGYAGAILVPGDKDLFGFYGKLGYQTAGTVTEFWANAGDKPVSLTPINTCQYARLRNTYLPTGSVTMQVAAFRFLETQAQFYQGENFLLAAAREGDTLLVQELLGNDAAAPGILRALGLPEGRFRTPGNGKAFGMLLPLQADCPIPAYVGPALD